MASQTENPVCKKFTDEGNERYKRGRLSAAISAYKKAIKADLNAVRPVRNLSAALFETGDYETCKKMTVRAKTLETRYKNVDMQAQIAKLDAREEKAVLSSNIASDEEQRERRLEILDRLGRYRPSMFSAREYYVVGHDEAQSLFDSSLNKSHRDDEVLSFFFGGAGDARHLLRSVIAISSDEDAKKIPEKKYHFTLNDINVRVLARNLVIWTMLDEMSEMTITEETDEFVDLMTTLFFTFTSPMMPRAAFDRLHQAIAKVLAILEDGKQPLSWVYIPKQDIDLYIDALKYWQGKALRVLPPSKVILRVAEEMEAKRKGISKFVTMTPTMYRNEKLLYMQSAALFPPQRFMEKHDSAMLRLWEQHSQQSKANANEFKDLLKKTWKTNTTFVDPSWYEENAEGDFSNDPFELINCLKNYHDESDTGPGNATRLYDHVAYFFGQFADALYHIKDRLVVEVVEGDCIDFADCLHFGLYQDQGNKSGNNKAKKFVRPNKFPNRYTRMSLSNVPDYIGGHLTTFLHMTPLLKDNLFSICQSNCLRNPPLWKTFEDFTAHYQRITSDEMLFSLTGIRVYDKGQGPSPLVCYSRYTKGILTPLPFESLLPREQFKTWFYSLFFQLTLPYNADIQNHSLIVYAPLNLTILFRLITHLRTLNYPSHWLSELLESICQPSITTSARPPRTMPTLKAEAEKKYPPKALSIAPFSQEIVTLTRLFQTLLPFSLSKSLSIPSLDEIHEYAFHLHNYNSMLPQPSCLILAFWDNDYLDALEPGGGHFSTFQFRMDIRPVIDPSWGDEVDAETKGKKFREFREKHIVFWSTFDFDVKKQVARAWIPRSLVEEWVKKGWAVGLWRTDVWGAMWGGVDYVKRTTKRGRRWDGGSEGEVDAEEGEKEEASERETEHGNEEDDEMDDTSEGELIDHIARMTQQVGFGHN
ncbi:hypothetical protein B0J14DRAFT_173642 [Halenospora varia]|nr:hypothetical protein B0J14DRAFT_173642 [Halenospora varia]